MVTGQFIQKSQIFTIACFEQYRIETVVVTILIIMIIMVNSVVDFAGNLRRAGGQAEVKEERREEESRRSEAAFQPAVTLMTPFITMCRLTS